MRDSETTVLTDSTVISGICVSCIHAPNCTHRLNSKQTLWFCEMFENETPVVPQQEAQPQNVNAEATNDSRYIGLCSNCENRETCTLPKPESGVWHCEEYA